MNLQREWQEVTSWFMKGTSITFKKGEILIRPEDKPTDVYYLEKGFLKAYSLTRMGDENIRNFKKSGDVFPIIWALKAESRLIYYQAVTDVIVHRRNNSDFLKLLKDNPGYGLALAGQIINLYSNYSERINNLEFRYARERIAYRLVFLSRFFGKKNSRGTVIQLPIKQIELADTTNVTRETASRELRRLKRKKLIEYSDSEYTVLDIKALEEEY